MKHIARSLVLVLSIFAATSASSHAQELTDRQLALAYDPATIQMPVEIVSIKVNGKEIHPGEKIKGDDNWLRGITFSVKNISDQPIAHVNVGFKFPLPAGYVVICVLTHGTDLSRTENRRGPISDVIQPGQTVDIGFTKQRYDSFLYGLEQAGAPKNFETAPYFVARVVFKNQPDVIWEAGYLKRRSPNDIDRFDPLEPYVLPVKQQ
jgi:hypothetical protein